LTGLEYLDFMANVYEVSPDEKKKRISYFLEMFDLVDAANDLIKSYSHGMKQRSCLPARCFTILPFG